MISALLGDLPMPALTLRIEMEAGCISTPTSPNELSIWPVSNWVDQVLTHYEDRQRRYDELKQQADRT